MFDVRMEIQENRKMGIRIAVYCMRMSANVILIIAFAKIETYLLFSA